jgi:N-acetyl-gamma-glutamyl-phosphate reductase
MVCVAITGASGLVGECLVRLLLQHPDAEITFLGSHRAAGQDIADVLPSLAGEISMPCAESTADAIAEAADVAFLAHKSSVSLELTPRLLDAGVKVIDIGGEFRLTDPALYQRWYGHEHTAHGALQEAVYGLPEVNRDAIRRARLVANPGCYPTNVILALLPLLADGLVAPDGIHISSASGLTGAGRTSGKLFIDSNEDMRAYALGGHKHRPEMEQELTAAIGKSVRITFVPHVLPLNRGILSTIFARPVGRASAEVLRGALSRRYDGERFVRVRNSGGEVCLANVRGTNFCDVAVDVDDDTGTVVVLSALDNMMKGACTQAIQNLNLLFGLDEAAGIAGVRGS